MASDVEFFLFGPEGRRLFGAFHPPKIDRSDALGVVICHPFGEEHIRSHRALLQLSTVLADSGFPTLRFDLYGCGDSDGDAAEASLEIWVADVDRAAQELIQGTGVHSVALVGLRLGAYVALLAHRAHAGLSRLVLWDPPPSGASYLAELVAWQEEWYRGSFASGPGGTREGLDEHLGFPIPRSFSRDVEALDLRALCRDLKAPLLIIETEREQALDSCFEQLRNEVRVERACFSALPIWRKQRTAVPGAGGVATFPEIYGHIGRWLGLA